MTGDERRCASRAHSASKAPVTSATSRPRGASSRSTVCASSRRSSAASSGGLPSAATSSRSRRAIASAAASARAERRRSVLPPREALVDRLRSEILDQRKAGLAVVEPQRRDAHAGAREKRCRRGEAPLRRGELRGVVATIQVAASPPGLHESSAASRRRRRVAESRSHRGHVAPTRRRPRSWQRRCAFRPHRARSPRHPIAATAFDTPARVLIILPPTRKRSWTPPPTPPPAAAPSCARWNARSTRRFPTPRSCTGRSGISNARAFRFV
jgi:hypothetical protein